MKMNPEEEMGEDHHRWRRRRAGRARRRAVRAGAAIIAGRRRAITVRRRGSGDVRRRGRGVGHPVGVRTMFDLAELIRVPCHRSREKQSACGRKANEELFHSQDRTRGGALWFKKFLHGVSKIRMGDKQRGAVAKGFQMRVAGTTRWPGARSAQEAAQW